MSPFSDISGFTDLGFTPSELGFQKAPANSGFSDLGFQNEPANGGFSDCGFQMEPAKSSGFHVFRKTSARSTPARSECSDVSSVVPTRHNVLGCQRMSKKRPKENLMLMTDLAHNDMLRASVFKASSQQMARADQYMAERSNREKEQQDWSNDRFRRLRDLARMHDQWRRQKSQKSKGKKEKKRVPSRAPTPFPQDTQGALEVTGTSTAGVPRKEAMDSYVDGCSEAPPGSARPKPKWTWEEAKRLAGFGGRKVQRLRPASSAVSQSENGRLSSPCRQYGELPGDLDFGWAAEGIPPPSSCKPRSAAAPRSARSSSVGVSFAGRNSPSPDSGFGGFRACASPDIDFGWAAHSEDDMHGFGMQQANFAGRSQTPGPPRSQTPGPPSSSGGAMQQMQMPPRSQTPGPPSSSGGIMRQTNFVGHAQMQIPPRSQTPGPPSTSAGAMQQADFVGYSQMQMPHRSQTPGPPSSSGGINGRPENSSRSISAGMLLGRPSSAGGHSVSSAGVKLGDYTSRRTIPSSARATPPTYIPVGMTTPIPVGIDFGAPPSSTSSDIDFGWAA